MPKAEGNVFCLVRMAMLRALEINAGSPPLISKTFSDKATSIALEEISQGKISLKKKEIQVKKNEE